MKTTIKDVANETGLAISTISKYLNGGRVRPANKEVIEKAILKLNYSPDNFARSLRTSRSHRVCLATGSGDNPHTSALMLEIEQKLWMEGYSLTYLNVDYYDRNRIGEFMECIMGAGIDGMILTFSGNSNGCLEALQKARIPIVAMEEGFQDIKTDCVQVDCAGGAYQAVENLIRAGHRRIAAISGLDRCLTSKERTRGYLRAMEDYDLPVPGEYLQNGKYSCQGGYESLGRLWGLKNRPTAVFIANYMMCLGAMERINELGICIPKELSVTTFDDFALSVMVRPRLTSIRQPLKELADETCALLIRRMNGDFENYPQKLRLKPKCIERDSVSLPL